MWKYDYLPVAQECANLLIELNRIINKFPRDYKYSYWTHIENNAINTLTKITMTAEYISKKKKSDCLEDAIVALSSLKVLWRVCNKIAIIDDVKYLKITENIISIERQLHWRINSIGEREYNDK